MAYRKLSIIIPVYNEIKTIRQVLDAVNLAPISGLEKEILLIDDASTDGTTELLKQISEPGVRTFFHAHNQGKGAALMTGFAAASGDIFIIQDADFEYDPNEIQKVIGPILNSNAKIVYGSRYLKPSTELTFWHSQMNQLFTGFANLLTGLKLTDIMTCYKAFTREALTSFNGKLESKRFGFEPEVTARLAKAGFGITEIPISYHARSTKQGKHMNLQGEIECLWVLIKYSFFA